MQALNLDDKSTNANTTNPFNFAEN